MWADEKNADEESSSTSETEPEENASEEASSPTSEPAPEENASETADESLAPPVEETERAARENRQMRAVVWIGGVAALILIIWGIVMWSRPQPETLDGFIARWNGVVLLDTDEAAKEQFEKLLLKSTVSSGSSWTTGEELLNKLRDGGVLLEPSDAPLLNEENRLSVQAAQTPDPDDENAAELTFHLDAKGPEYTFNMERGGWARQWRISDMASQTPAIALEPSPVVETPGAMDADPLVETAEPTQEEGAPIDTQLKLRQILDAWQTAWERRDVEDYIKWYADFAEIVRVTVVEGSEIREPLTVAELRARMMRLAQKYSDIDIKISNLSIEGDRAEADLQFNQTYKAYRDADGQNEIAYSDEGRKTLKFVVNENGEWRIYHENWTTYMQVPSFPLD